MIRTSWRLLKVDKKDKKMESKTKSYHVHIMACRATREAPALQRTGKLELLVPLEGSFLLTVDTS